MNNRVTRLPHFVIAFLFIVLALQARAQCVGCARDGAGGKYSQSGNAIACMATPPPPPSCAVGAVSTGARASLDSFHPGMLFTTTDGKTTVSYVLPNSPADNAGIKKGDVLLSINGHPFGAPGGQHAWSTSSQPNFSVVSYLRDGRATNIQIQLLPIRELLRNEMRRRIIQSASSSQGGDAIGNSFSNARPFISGLSILSVNGGLIVDAVLTGSPADRAGIQPGDQITEIDGKAAGTEQAGSIARKFETASPRRLELSLVSGAQTRKVSLETAGVSSVLRQIGNSHEITAQTILVADTLD